MPSAALRAAHCLSTGRHAGRRPAAARGIAYCLLAVALLAPAGAAAADDCLQQIALQPGRSVDVVVSASRLLIEEVGTDIEYRWNTGEDFTAVATPPDRLGFDVLAARSPTLTLRIRGGQGGGQIRIGSCLDDADATFFSGLAALQTRSLEAGRDAARAALPALTYLRRWPLDARHAGWISSAHANILTSAGENNAAETAFLDSSRDWQQAGRPDRAAIALMAAGDNASRANRFDVAREWLTQARDELERLGVTYYALRSEGSLCTVLARQSDVDAAIACESQLIPRWIANGERRETAVRQISAGNLSLRAGGRLPAARQFFLDAEQSASVLSPVLLSRLSAGLGNYELMLGNFPAAATHYARAVHRLGNAGIPDEQTNLDMRLALLASVAGALPDQIRLLESAQKRLSEANDPIRLGEVNLLLAKPLLRLGDPQKALSAARTASRLCSAAENRRCIELATLIEIETLAALDPSAAEKKLAELPALSEPSANGRRIYLEAKVQLALARPSESLRLLGRLNLQRNDLELQTDVSLLRAESLQQLGQRENAMTELGTTIRAESEAVSDWTSVALVISARAYLVELQSAFFDLALAASNESAQTSGLDAIRSVVQATDPRRLLQRRSATTLPESVRRKLSASIIENRLDSRREAFAAMTQGTAQTKPRLVPAQRPAQTSPNHQTVLLPAIGKEGFSLLAVSGTQVQTCLRWTASRYRDLAARFSNVLDGADGDVAGLHEAAADLHGAVRACSRGNVGNWHVVKLPGVPLLPWSWIAAAGPATDEEPAVTISFTLPDTWDSALAKPASLLLLDLDMPSVAPLPLASVEADTLSSELSKKGIDAQHLRASELSLDDINRALAAADVVHIVGHANPATFGSLYQGLWFESGSAGTLITYPEIAGRDLRAELVVLSACGTRPDQTGSQFAWSLAEAFVAAGAQRVVSAANPLSDAAGPLWTKTFHDTVWRTGDAAIAARSARQALRKSPHFRHPKFWAGIDYFISAGEKPPVQVDDSSSVRHDNEE